MSARTAAPIAWSLWLLIVIFIAATIDLSGMDWYLLSHPRLQAPGRSAEP
jgi:hypothetical protein